VKKYLELDERPTPTVPTADADVSMADGAAAAAVPSVPPSQSTEDLEWVQCAKCEKWRTCGDTTALPDVWDCSMNTYHTALNSCDAPEEKAETEGASQPAVVAAPAPPPPVASTWPTVQSSGTFEGIEIGSLVQKPASAGVASKAGKVVSYREPLFAVKMEGEYLTDMTIDILTPLLVVKPAVKPKGKKRAKTLKTYFDANLAMAVMVIKRRAELATNNRRVDTAVEKSLFRKDGGIHHRDG